MNNEPENENTERSPLRLNLIETARNAFLALTADEQEFLLAELSQHCPIFISGGSDSP